MRKFILLTLLLANMLPGNLEAQYYVNALGKNGTQLKTALHNIIKNHSAQAWPLWNFFPATDTKSGTMVWDIYTDQPGGIPADTFYFVTDQCGNYSAEGDCFNHEHTWPSTYFNDASPMASDLHHILPTDGYVNNKRSNLPYGNVSNISWTGHNGSQTGFSNSYAGYTDKVFEPIDSFKGDVARLYFYMSTRYENEDAGWKNWPMANGAQLTSDAINLLLNWHHSDPVSQKELNRNNAVYQIQLNRNPFIDYPIFADCIWGTADCTPLGISAVQASAQLQIFPVPADEQINITCGPDLAIQGLTIYSTSGTQLIHQTGSTPGLSLRELQAGTYILGIQTAQGVVRKLFTKK